MNPDGTGIVKVVGGHTHVEKFPVWSPDGSQIAFTKTELSVEEVVGPFGGTRLRARASDTSDIYIVNVDGSGLTRLTGGMDAHVPDWSPDG